jgi:hypothetical protein
VGSARTNKQTDRRTFDFICIYIYIYSGMIPEMQNSRASKTATARQRLFKQATIPEPLLDNESVSNNGGTVLGDVFCVVPAGAIWEGCLNKPTEYAVCSESMRLAWDGRQPARTCAQKQRNVRCWKPLPSNVTENTGLCVIVICEVSSLVV